MSADPVAASNEAIAGRCPVCLGDRVTTYVAYPEFSWLRCRCGAIFKQPALGAPPEDRAGFGVLRKGRVR